MIYDGHTCHGLKIGSIYGRICGTYFIDIANTMSLYGPTGLMMLFIQQGHTTCMTLL